ncbi:MAG: acetylxylan esterase [Candidatus Glassbacteria bacterium]|nr:acetylxylan esterase [Candidatus Glassbacteria bacterium]
MAYRSYLHFLAALLAASLFCRPALAAEVSLSVKADRPEQLYRLGEEAVFRVAVEGPGKLEGLSAVSYRLSEDGERTLAEGGLDLVRGRAELSGKLDRPGFLRLDLSLPAGEDTLRASCACGFAVEAIRSTGELPEDFDRFWREAAAELLRIPIDPLLVPVQAREKPGAAHYRVSLAGVQGTRVYGWLSLPGGAGPFPTALYLPGAGVAEIRAPDEYIRAGMLVLAIDVHGIEQGRPEEWYRSLRWREGGVLRDYPHFGKEDPYTFYYRRVIQGAMRALDYLYTRADVDTTRLAVVGSSQGGALSLLTAGLDKRIKALTANVPAMCDHTGSLYGRPSGWPRLLRDGDRGRVLRTCGYYDAALAAGLIEVPARLAVGFVDQVCAPTTVYAAYNNLKGPKSIDHFPEMGHSYGEGWLDESVRWLLDRLNEQAADSRN